MPEILIQYSRGTAFSSDIICRLCHSDFSHCDIRIESERVNGLLGVSGEDHKLGDPGGVRLRPIPPWEYRHPPKIARLKTSDYIYDKVLEVGYGQLDKPFDNGALWGFLSDTQGDRDWRDTSSWFCSEFVIYCLEQAGFFPYQLIAAKNRITPGDSLHLLNPFMSPENIEEFRPWPTILPVQSG